jgi:hypothetical protein
MEEIFKILNLVLKFDVQNNPVDGTVRYMQPVKKRRNGGVPLTQKDRIAARLLSRAFPLIKFSI